MAAPTVDGTKLLTGPGILYWASLGTAEPTHTAAGSKFTDAWPVGWSALGNTDGGHTFTDAVTTGDVDVEESYYAVKILTTGRTASWKVNLAEINMSNLKKALNGGTLTTSGSGATLISSLTPPTIGSEVRAQVGWQSDDDTVRFIGYQAFQVGSIDVTFKKGTDKALIPVEFRLEQPTSGSPYKFLGAGTVRG